MSTTKKLKSGQRANKKLKRVVLRSSLFGRINFSFHPNFRQFSIVYVQNFEWSLTLKSVTIFSPIFSIENHKGFSFHASQVLVEIIEFYLTQVPISYRFYQRFIRFRELVIFPPFFHLFFFFCYSRRILSIAPVLMPSSMPVISLFLSIRRMVENQSNTKKK